MAEKMFENIWKIVCSDLVPKLAKNRGLTVFACNRAKFEAWLKVELVGVLTNHFKEVCPEKNSFDIVCNNWSIELKTLNTNYRYKNVLNKHCNITNNTQGVINDIEKLQKNSVTNKAILFVVFPVKHEHEKWQVQLKRIQEHLVDLKFAKFSFKNQVPAMIYFGLV